MPWTIYGYILREFTKVLIPTLLVLVMITSFAAALKPLSDGLLSPGTFVRFVLFMSPTMIQFTLPFAGAFACVLVLNRMVADNEVLACRAGGIGYGLLLMPIAVLGVVFMLSLFVLSNWMIPRFFQAAERTLENDVTQMLVAELSRGRPFDKLRDDLVLYADDAYVDDEPPHIEGAPVQPSRLIMLRGVAVAMLDDAGGLAADATAEQADIYLFRDERTQRSWMALRLTNAQGYDITNQRAIAFTDQPVFNIPVPSPFQDEPQFLSWPELRRLGQEPLRFDDVATARDRLARAVAREKLLGALEETWRQGSGAMFIGSRPGERYILHAPAWQRSDKGVVLDAREDEPVVIEFLSGGLISRRYHAQHAEVEVEVDEPLVEPALQIKLTGAQVFNERFGGRGTELTEWNMPAMRWPDDLIGPLQRTGELAAVRVAAAPYRNNPTLEKSYQRLNIQLRSLGREIIAELHKRAASAIGCLIVLLFAAIISLLWEGQMPLVVFFWSFLVAAVNVLIAESGENIAQATDGPFLYGLILLWTGVCVSSLVIFIMYRELAKQ